MDRVVLDTDVSSLSLKHRLPPQVLVRLIGKQPCVTFVTVGELTQWAELRQWGRRNRDALEHWLGGVIVLPYSEEVARMWGRISASTTASTCSSGSSTFVAVAPSSTEERRRCGNDGKPSRGGRPGDC
jgi:predicted nucleic acid-binding protein